jgi:hypothetical protein
MQVLKSPTPVHSDVVKSAPVQLDTDVLKHVAGGSVVTPQGPDTMVVETPSDPTW